MDISNKNFIKEWRKVSNLTQEDIASYSGYSRNYIAKIESGIRRPSMKFLEKIAGVFNIPVSKLFIDPILHPEITEVPSETIDKFFKSPTTEPLSAQLIGSLDESDTIPLLTSIPAGHWKEWDDQYPTVLGEEKVPRYDIIKGKHVIALRVYDDSMIGENLHKEDLIYIDPEIPFIPSRAGRIGVVRFNGSYKIRRLFLSNDGQRYRLVPANSNYEEEEMPVAETTIFKVVRWMPNTEGMF